MQIINYHAHIKGIFGAEPMIVPPAVPVRKAAALRRRTDRPGRSVTSAERTDRARGPGSKTERWARVAERDRKESI